MRNLRVLVAYDGSRFAGWQRQDGFETAQQALEEALLELTGQPCVVHGASRTDSGVHALGQVASFFASTRLDDDRFRHALNAHLPRGVVVQRLETCRDDFHARYSARGKRYLYVVATSRFRLPFANDYAHWTNQPLASGAVSEAASLLVGKHDFVAFSSVGAPRRSTVRTIQHLHLLPRRRSFAFVVQGDGFLYNMVRIVAGTLLDVGRGRITPADVARALECGDRNLVGATAPAEGLYLLRVLYDEPVFTAPDRGVRGTSGWRFEAREPQELP